jgi:hypothetical protein
MMERKFWEAVVVGTVQRTINVIAEDEATARLHAEQHLKLMTGATLPEVVEIEEVSNDADS